MLSGPSGSRTGFHNSKGEEMPRGQGHEGNAWREYIIQRDKCTCQICGKVGEYINYYGKPYVCEWVKQNYNFDSVIDVRVSFEFDHIIPKALGGTHSLHNLQLLCRRCNRSKGGRKRDGKAIQADS